MTIETIRATIDLERIMLISLQGKVSSPVLKQQCQTAWKYLEDCESFCLDGASPASLEQAAQFLQMAIGQRRAVEDYVRKWGYDAETTPSKQS